MKAAETSDEQLLDELLSGSEEAFLALYRRHQGRIYRFAWQMSGSEPVAEEVTQEVFLTVLHGARGFDARRGSLAGYLLGTARHQVLRLLRRDGAYEPLPEEAEEPRAGTENALAELSRRQTVETVRRAVLQLPSKYREAVVLCDLEEMDYSAAAESLGCSLGTLKSRLHRGRQLLEDKLSDRRPNLECRI